MHVLGPADDAQLGHRLVRGDHQLHPWAQAVNEPLAAFGMPGASGPEDRPPRLDADFAIEAERAAAAPPQTMGVSPREA